MQAAFEYLYLFIHLTHRVVSELVDTDEHHYFSISLTYFVDCEIQNDVRPYIDDVQKGIESLTGRRLEIDTQGEISGYYLTLFAKEFEEFPPGVELRKLDCAELATRQSEYCGYPAFAPEESGPAGTLFWEFGRIISGVASGNSLDIRYIMLAETAASSFFETMATIREDLKAIMKRYHYPRAWFPTAEAERLMARQFACPACASMLDFVAGGKYGARALCRKCGKSYG
jgi:hypothetical protein